MATGVAIAVAAPFSAIAASAPPVADEEYWPEFQQWLKDAQALDACYVRSGAAHDAGKIEEYRALEAYQDTEMERLCEISGAMSARPARTETQIAMLTTFAVWSADKRVNSNNSFDLTGIADPTDDIFESASVRLIKATARRAAELLPEVPFKFDAEA